MSQNFDIIIVGGGAGGFFTAINIAEKNPKLKIAILERGKEVLTKDQVADDKFLSGVNFYVKGVEGKVPGAK